MAEKRKGLFQKYLDNKNEKKFAKEKADELHELIVATDGVDEFADNTLNNFVTTKDEIIEFAKKFITISIKNEALKNKLISGMDGFDLVVLKPDETFNKAPGSVGYDTKTGVVNKYAVVGTETPDGKIKTNLKNIKIFIHEIFHSASLKHDTKHIESKLANNENVEISHDIGEIESLFLEGMFNHVMSENIDEFSTGEGYPFDLSKKEIVEDAQKMQRQELVDFRNKAKKIKNPKDIERAGGKSFDFRYVMGYVASDMLIGTYEENPQQASDILLHYLENDARLDVDSAMKVLSGGKVHQNPDGSYAVIGGEIASYGQAMNKFKSRFKSKTSRVSEDEMAEVRNSLDAEKTKVPDYSNSVSKSRNGTGLSSDTQELNNEIQSEK